MPLSKGVKIEVTGEKSPARAENRPMSDSLDSCYFQKNSLKTDI
jgi:hypothetical protein